MNSQKLEVVQDFTYCGVSLEGKSIKVKGIQTLRANDKCLMRVTSMEVKYTSTGFWYGNLREYYHLKDLSKDGRVY